MAPFKVGSVDVIQCPMVPPDWEPKIPSSKVLPAGYKRTAEALALPTSIIFDEDQVIRLRDGCRIRVDIYRPVCEERVPAVVMWSPYGKSGSGM